MGHHTFDAAKADKLERPERRYRFLSAEELLWALDLDANDTVADLGSGTGFYTDHVARNAGAVYAVDLQTEMHDYYREKGVPENVTLVTNAVSDLPFDAGSIDAALSTMTYHEFPTAETLAEVHRIMASGGQFVVVDYSARGTGSEGPPLDERSVAEKVTETLQATGFHVQHEAVRPETFLVVATRK